MAEPKKMRLFQEIRYIVGSSDIDELKRDIEGAGLEPVEWDRLEALPRDGWTAMAYKNPNGVKISGLKEVVLEPGMWIFWQGAPKDVSEKKVAMELESSALWMGLGSVEKRVFQRYVVEPNGVVTQYWARVAEQD